MTGRPTPPLLALDPTPGVANRIKAVLHIGSSSRVIGPMLSASSWRELAELGDRHPGAPAIVDTTERARWPFVLEARRASRRDWSATPLIQYGAPGPPEPSPTVPKLPFAARVRRGVKPEITPLDTAILRSIDANRVHRLLERARRGAHPFAQRLLQHALNRSIDASTVPEAADSLVMAERTLYRRCARLGIPAPRAILSLARIFTVERLAAWSRQPGGAVALALGFSDRANYRRLARRRVGFPPSVIRERGGADYVEGVIVRRLGPR